MSNRDLFLESFKEISTNLSHLPRKERRRMAREVAKIVRQEERTARREAEVKQLAGSEANV